ncbi:jerky protein homolog-like [Bactrocera dorsalis]|uniref:Jerky protein homolog-like n=1 Tax=Bactrocera dorsalis TaxID=27457 RepID=A0ABM3JCL3_BACDO|nr:jerky protein homolog-like [Bactrocera dorsalis]
MLVVPVEFQLLFPPQVLENTTVGYTLPDFIHVLQFKPTVELQLSELRLSESPIMRYYSSPREASEKQEYGEDDDDEDALSLEEIRKIIVKIPGCSEVSAEDVGEWMACDTSDPGFQILNDDEIVVSVREDVEVEEELSADVEVDAGPSASEAFAGLETALKWMERQPECDHLQLLTVKRMRDLAVRKR